MKKLLLSLAISALFGSAVAQTAPTAPTQASAPAITTQSTTRFAAGVTASLNAATTNIIYLEQTGNAPTVSINQDGNSNRAGSDATGAINSMILNGNNQVVTIDQTGNNNVINTLKVIGNAAHIFEKNLDKINLIWLSQNPNAIHILEQNLDNVDWDFLSANPNAIHILEDNLNKIEWKEISSIFQITPPS